MYMYTYGARRRTALVMLLVPLPEFTAQERGNGVVWPTAAGAQPCYFRKRNCLTIPGNNTGLILPRCPNSISFPVVRVRYSVTVIANSETRKRILVRTLLLCASASDHAGPVALCIRLPWYYSSSHCTLHRIAPHSTTLQPFSSCYGMVSTQQQMRMHGRRQRGTASARASPPFQQPSEPCSSGWARWAHCSGCRQGVLMN